MEEVNGLEFSHGSLEVFKAGPPAVKSPRRKKPLLSLSEEVDRDRQHTKRKALSEVDRNTVFDRRPPKKADRYIVLDGGPPTPISEYTEGNFDGAHKGCGYSIFCMLPVMLNTAVGDICLFSHPQEACQNGNNSPKVHTAPNSHVMKHEGRIDQMNTNAPSRSSLDSADACSPADI